jgi:hypothetical protein
MVRDDGAVRCGERFDEMAKIERPGGIPMDHDQCVAFSLVDEMKRHALSVQITGAKRIQVLIIGRIDRSS